MRSEREANRFINRIIIIVNAPLALATISTSIAATIFDNTLTASLYQWTAYAFIVSAATGCGLYLTTSWRKFYSGTP